MMKEMKTRKKLIIGMAMLGIACVGVGVATAKPLSANAETQGLTGFTSPGASVFIATDGTDTKQMRFQVNLDSTADETYKTAAAGKTLQSGVVVLPYDIYQSEGYTELTKDTPQAVTAEVTENWEANENGYQSYAYLPVDLIPENQYNRILIARGYVIDGENVYYTEPVRASMAYVAWKNIGMAEGVYDTTLNGYRGSYTLSYDGGSISDLKYGDTFYQSLPTEMDGYSVQSWYWDEAKTNAIQSTDYATGTMPVYYKLQEFTVSGTVSCADSIDLTTVEIAVDGVKTTAKPDANGDYSVSVEPGTHKFTFSCPGYKVYVNTEVSGNCTLGNAELKADLYEVGKFGNVKTNEGLVDENNFSGNYTVNNSNNYLLMMPNTATTDNFTYTVKVTNPTSERKDKAYAASVSNGSWALSIGLYEWETIVVNLSSKGGAGFISYYDMSGSQQYNDRTIKMVRTANDIKVYVDNTLYFTFTSTGITPATGVSNRGWNPNSFEPNQGNLAGFFGENVSLACGIAAVNGSEFTATYTCNVEKYVKVSGTITADASVDLTQTVLTVDGVATAMTVNADGTYTASVPEGTHTLAFENGVWSATKEVTIVSGSNTVDVTLVIGTWRVGNYGKVNSNNTPAFNENGTYTVKGVNQLILFPNTATSGAFEYTVKVSNVTRGNDEDSFGICLTDGNYVLTVACRKYQYVVNMSTKAGNAYIAYYNGGKASGTLKFIVSSEKIESYLGNTLLFTFTKDAFSTTLGRMSWDKDTKLATNYATSIAGFFAEGSKLVCGISTAGGKTSSVSATYACAITKN